MDVKEVKSKRNKLEALILKEIKNFEEETGTSICSVVIERYQGGATRHGVIQGVEVELKF